MTATDAFAAALSALVDARLDAKLDQLCALLDARLPATDGERLLTLAQVAERLACSESYVEQHLIATARLPRLVMPGGRSIRYREADLNQAIRSLPGVRVPAAAPTPIRAARRNGGRRTATG